MKLISKVEFDHFRSIRSAQIERPGDFTAFAGLNNAGKSNVLRALHSFFVGYTDVGVDLDYSRDYYRQDANSKKRAKNISVAVTFNLPDAFRFRKGLENVEQLLGREFTIRKSWERNNTTSRYFLNESSSELSLDNRAKVDAFLNLINFRYIPNRVLPLDIIRNEHQALRDVLVRRLAKRAKTKEDVFDAIRSTSESLLSALQNSVKSACPEVGNIRLATPTSWQDLVFAFGYKLASGNMEFDDAAQGSGIQSLLMFETLSLIDRDYFQKFGWKQASIWAVEEPESSLHTSLEARIAAYLNNIAKEDKSRLQILCTTHSDLMLQHADHVVFVEMVKGTSNFVTSERQQVLERAARLGISRWTHPILCEPLSPIILVEGKYDFSFLEQALKILAPQKNIRVSYLDLLQGQNSGGKDALLTYIRANHSAIKTRSPKAPVIVVLDWDAKNKAAEFQKNFSQKDPFGVMVWPDTAFNPKFGTAIRGIERHFSDRIIEEADANLSLLGQRKDGSFTIHHDDYGKLKEAAYKVVECGIREDDIVHAKSFLTEILNRV